MRNKRFGKLLSAALAAAMALSLSSAALAAGNGETHPVSYTHLDVYKRQT